MGFALKRTLTIVCEKFPANSKNKGWAERVPLVSFNFRKLTQWKQLSLKIAIAEHTHNMRRSVL
jgi:hypothetical protein